MDQEKLEYDVIVIGAGVSGIYQIKRLIESGFSATVLDASPDLGGTWYWNRYPGARFDSESYSYGYSFSKELLDEWHWNERFSSQPENLRYLNYVADKFDLRCHMQFNCRVQLAQYDEACRLWRLHAQDGRDFTARYVVMAVGLLSTPTLPNIPGIDSFEGRQFHTFHWPHEPLDLTGRNVAVIGTGATGIQVIAEIADKVGELTVFQRRPNWSAPLNNGPISDEEMADIRARYDEIFAVCARTPGGFIHEPDPRSFHDVSPEARKALWDKLYAEPGFGILLSNFPEIFFEEEANAAISDYIAGRIRARVKDPETAETLIPKDHGFGVQRLPLETRYFEAYNRPNVTLVDVKKSPIQAITAKGIRTVDHEYAFDYIVYATGFDAVTGAYDKIDIRGIEGESLADKWRDGPVTAFGVLVPGFPNLLMATGPQGSSAAGNYPRGIETSVNWCMDLLNHAQECGFTRIEASEEAERRWTEHVMALSAKMLMRNAKSWFTGYNSNVKGHGEGVVRYLVYSGGQNKYAYRMNKLAQGGYEGIDFA